MGCVIVFVVAAAVRDVGVGAVVVRRRSVYISVAIHTLVADFVFSAAFLVLVVDTAAAIFAFCDHAKNTADAATAVAQT